MRAIFLFIAFGTAFVIPKSLSTVTAPRHNDGDRSLQTSLNRDGSRDQDLSDYKIDVATVRIAEENSVLSKDAQSHRFPWDIRTDQTVFEVISNSEHTTKLASLVNRYPDLVAELSNTNLNYSIFAPTDYALSKLPNYNDISALELERILKYHIVPEVFPAHEISQNPTIATLLRPSTLNGPQRLRVGLSSDGFVLNDVSKIQKLDIPGTNGWVHEIDSVVLPPPSMMRVIEQLPPAKFSIFQLAVMKTGFANFLNEEMLVSSTIFVPSNIAFEHLGHEVNAFLFGVQGLSYLHALLRYHVIGNQTFFTDGMYNDDHVNAIPHGGFWRDDDVRKGFKHVEFPTMLEDCKIQVDLARYGPWMAMRLNKMSLVTLQNEMASDGVVHGVNRVFVPPMNCNGGMRLEGEIYVDVQELNDRLEVYL